jgi:hypothetical protein
MHIRADNDPRYGRKFLIMGLIALGFAVYCLYDGLVGYPKRREAGFEEFKADYKTLFTNEHQRSLSLAQFEVVKDEKQRHEWDNYIESRGIPSGPAVAMQFIMAAGSTLAALILLSIPLRARGKWIEINDEGVVSSWGPGFYFDQVEGLNKRRWKNKGIAKVAYRDGNNGKRVFVVDDYKFERWRTDAILYVLEKRIDAGLITNGPPEPEPIGKVAEILGFADSAGDNDGDGVPA